MSSSTIETASPKILTMNAAFALDVMLHWPVRHSILFVGDHGVGKDGIVKTAAMIQGIPCVDIRLSQNDVGDIKGMPFRVKGRTLFAPPDWMPFEDDTEMDLDELVGCVATAASKRSSASRGILFFNEINRAIREVQQAAFEIVLDRTMNTRVLREGWRIASAVNGDDHYQVNVMDVAFKSRFYIIKFRPSVEEWLAWAKDPVIKAVAQDPRVLDIISRVIDGPLHPVVRGYIERHPNMLDPTEELLTQAESDVTMQVQNRRAWHMFSDCILVREALAEIGIVPTVLSKEDGALEYLQIMGMGYVGPMAAIDFASYVQTDYEVLDGNIILNKWTNEVADKVKVVVEAGRTIELCRYNDMVVSLVKGMKVKKLTEGQKSNLSAYFKLLPNAQRAHIYKNFTNEDRAVALDWYSDKKVEKMVLDALMAPSQEKAA